MILSFGNDGRMYTPKGDYVHVSRLHEYNTNKMNTEAIISILDFDKNRYLIVLSRSHFIFDKESSATKQMLGDLGCYVDTDFNEDNSANDNNYIGKANFSGLEGKMVEVYY